MKTLARLILASFAAQLLFVSVVNAKIISSPSAAKSTICATPDDYDPFEGFLTPDDYDPFEGF